MANYKSTRIRNRKITKEIPLTPALEAKASSLTPADLGIDPEYVILSTVVNRRNELKPTLKIVAERSPEMTFDKIMQANKILNTSKVKAYTPKATGERPVMALLNMYDFHLGRLAHASEVYGQNYDTKIACEVFKKNSERIFADMKSLPYHYDMIVLNYGGDFFNADNEDNLTTSLSHTVDCDTRHFDYYIKGVDLMTAQILTALEIADRVYIPMTPGNHDHQTFKHAIHALANRFHDEPRVMVELDDNNRSTINWKNNLIVLTHGVEKSRVKTLPLTEPESRELFSMASNVEVISGHTHEHKITPTGLGYIWETCGQMAPVADAWTAECGYAEAVGECYLNIYDDSHRIAQMTYYLKDFLPKVKARNSSWNKIVKLDVANFDKRVSSKAKAEKAPAKKTASKKTNKKPAAAKKTSKSKK